MQEPPYGVIVDLLKRGEVVPFLGAGINYNMRQPGARWDKKTSAFFPSGAELAATLASDISFPSTDDRDVTDLAKVSSYFAESVARLRLRESLHQIFNRNYTPTALHAYLASIDAPLLIITTNYDDLTEQAFRDAGRAYDLVVHPTDRADMKAAVLWWRSGATKAEAVFPNRLYIDLKTTTVIYKMHGTVDKAGGEGDSYVITEDDYVDFLSRMMSESAVPKLFMKHIRSRHLLFLGYSLRDWNLRVVLKNIRTKSSESSDESTGKEAEESKDTQESMEELRSWAIQFEPTELEIELWKARNVRIYAQDIDVFVQKLRDH